MIVAVCQLCRLVIKCKKCCTIVKYLRGPKHIVLYLIVEHIQRLFPPASDVWTSRTSRSIYFHSSALISQTCRQMQYSATVWPSCSTSSIQSFKPEWSGPVGGALQVPSGSFQAFTRTLIPNQSLLTIHLALIQQCWWSWHSWCWQYVPRRPERSH